MHKRILALLMALALLGAMPLTAFAHEVPDPARLGSITVNLTYQDEPLAGGTLTLYRVADVATYDGNYFFEYTADFAECSIPVEELESADLPEALAKIAKEKGLKGTTLAVGADGRAIFSDLTIGLYLIVQEEAPEGFKRINPFLVSVPQIDDERYDYDVDTAPKNLPGPETEPTEPTTTPTEPTTPPGLPQTGLTNWPVPVLAVAGMLLIVAGFACCVSGRKKNDEA